jgi:hypothetical protein
MENNNKFVGSVNEVIEAVANKYVWLMTRFVIKNFDDNFELKTSLRFGRKQNMSWGGERKGKPFISLALYKYRFSVADNSNRLFGEYKSFAKDPVIGSISCNWQKAILVLIAHEIAHAIQHGCDYWKVQETLGVKIKFENGHGDYFKTIYAYLRTNFVEKNFEFLDYTLQTEQATTLKPVEKQKSKKKTGIKMVLSKANGGWFIHKYYDVETNELLAHMASKPKHYCQVNRNGVWENVHNEAGDLVSKQIEARKIVIGR